MAGFWKMYFSDLSLIFTPLLDSKEFYLLQIKKFQFAINDSFVTGTI